MERQNLFGNYTLSKGTLDKLKEADNLLERDVCPSNPAWFVIKPKHKIKNEIQDEDQSSVHQEDANVSENDGEEAPLVPSTQFFFSQVQRIHNSPINEAEESNWSNVAESLYESLEKINNETPQLLYLKNLSDSNVNKVVEYLSEKLSSKGIYNLCRLIRETDVDQSTSYIRIICSNLLLRKIIDLEEPSRLMSSAVHELVENFSEDIVELIFIPILNADLKDITTVSTIINSFPSQRKSDLIIDFLASVRELKEWHISILSLLISTKVSDPTARKKLLNLLLEKASIYSRDKNYSKFMLSFLKLNAPFIEDEKRSLSEIVAVNETIFKRVMETLLKNMYLYGDLWHIS